MIESGTTKCTILWDGAEIGTCTSTDAAIIAGFPMPEASPGWHTVTLRETFELVPRPVIIRFQAQSQAQSLLVPVKWERSADIMTQTEVPAVVGGRLSAALNDIADAQLTEGITETSEFEDGDDPSEWEVVQQDPEAGEYLDPGSAVILSVRPVTVPPTEPEPPLPPPVNQPGDGTPGTTEPRAGDGGATKSSEPPGRPEAPPTTTGAPVVVPPAPAAQPPAPGLQPLAWLRAPLMFALLVAVVFGCAYLLIARHEQSMERGSLLAAPPPPFVGVPAEPPHVAGVPRGSERSTAPVRLVGHPDPGHIVSVPRESGRSIAVRLAGQPDPGHIASVARDTGRSIAVRLAGQPDAGQQEIVEHRR